MPVELKKVYKWFIGSWPLADVVGATNVVFCSNGIIGHQYRCKDGNTYGLWPFQSEEMYYNWIICYLTDVRNNIIDRMGKINV